MHGAMKKQYSENNRNEQGVVLLIVLILMVFVAALAVDIVRTARYDYAGATYQKNLCGSIAVLNSAAEVGQQMFIEFNSTSDVTRFERLAKSFNSTLKKVSSSLSSGEVVGAMEDENSRFPLYSSSRNATKADAILTNLITYVCRKHGYDDDNLKENAENFVSSIRCWTGNGTTCEDDSDFYNSADPAYSRPERPILSPDELLLIKRPDDWLTDKEFLRVYQGTDKIVGLKDLVTSFSQGPVNINTLKDEVILAFVPDGKSSDDRQNFLDDVRAKREDRSGKEKWFDSVKRNYSHFKSTIPEVGYSTQTARVTIDYNNGIFTSSVQEIFKIEGTAVEVKYKKFVP